MFAVAQRTLGRKWKDIRREITELYKIRAPSDRQMRLWFNQWGPKSKTVGSDTAFPGLRERLLRLQNTYKYLSSDSAFNRELVTAGLLLHHIDSIASRSEFDQEHKLESIVAILTLIERWGGASTLDQALLEFQMVRAGQSSLFHGSHTPGEKQSYTSEEKEIFVVPIGLTP